MIKLFLKKYKIIIVLFLLLILAVIMKYSFKDNGPSEVYDVLVMARDQVNLDAQADKKFSLKIGDVLLVKKPGHKWSDTEKVSYLILKMSLTEEEVQKITAPVEKKLSKKEIEAELEKQRAKTTDEAETDRYEKELEDRQEIIQARKYRINMDKFEGFNADMLISGQPYADEVFDWGIVEKVKS